SSPPVSCACTRGRHTAHLEKTAAPAVRSIGVSPIRREQGGTMIKIAYAGVWVHDQDEALAFYTEKLGWELRADVTRPEFGNYRWLTVGPPAQPDVSVLLNAIPGPPVVDAATAEEIRSLMAKGWAGNVLLNTDDAHASYEELKQRGVEFVEAPEERPYGI